MQPSRWTYSCNETANNALGARAAHALTSALADPYEHSQSRSSYINPNYAQAYLNQMSQAQQHHWARTTEEGYTISSAYHPTSSITPSSTSSSYPRPNHLSSSFSSQNRGRTSSSHLPIRAHSNHSNKQQHDLPRLPHRRPPAPGDIECAYTACSFSGSKYAVEIHRMDRHLIYPPNWKKKTDGWDADPSLKGKPIPISGTGLVLDTPESIDAWVAERKKKWPSKSNVEQKKKKEQEAEQRGEINPSDLFHSTANRMKKRRFGFNEERNHGRSSPSSNTHKRARTIGGLKVANQRPGLETTTAADSDNPSPAFDTHVNQQPQNEVSVSDVVPPSIFPSSLADDDNGSDDQSGSDVDPVRDAISSKKPVDEKRVEEQYESGQSTLQKPHATKSAHRNEKPFPQPKRPVCYPFTSKSKLLQNLLLPEIKNTVSHLSQAIHFLVENDFLVGVELKPGDADAQLIRVLVNEET